MTRCSNNRSTRFSIGENPFGNLLGGYSCGPISCNFSADALTEMRRRGFSPDYLRSITTDAQIGNAAANAIRAKIPRTVTLPLPRAELSPDDQTRYDAALADIALMEKRLREAENLAVPSGAFNQRLVNKYLGYLKTARETVAELDKVASRSITTNGIDIRVGDDSGVVNDNPLNCYIDVQYHVGLTMLSAEEAAKFQQGGFNVGGIDIDLNTLKATNRADRSVTLASTGEVFTNNLFRGDGPSSDDPNANTRRTSRNYYNITELVVKNIMEPSSTNPLISTMLSMKMKIAEPHGFKLHEDIKNTACDLGYDDINVGRVLYRVDIYFSGYDQDTGEWHEQIPIGKQNSVTTISSVMAISSIEAEVTTSGTLYEVGFVPAGHFAYRPEDFVMDAQAVSSGTTFRDFLQNFSIALNDSKSNRTQNQIIRNYEFYAPTMLLDSPFDIDEFFNRGYFISADGDPNHVVSSGKDIDIMTVLEGALANVVAAQALFNADDNNDAFDTPRIHFTVRFNSVYGQKDVALHDYKDITHQYIIEPYITFKQGPVSKETMNTYVAPQSQLARLREIIKFGMLRRIYNYINTDENTEVIDFDIRLKNFYYNSLNLSRNDQSSGGARSSGPATTQITNKLQENDLFRVLADGPTFQDVEGTLRRLFGPYRYDLNGQGGSESCLSGAARLGGGFNETPQDQLFGDVVSPALKRRNDYETYMRDYLDLDLLTLDGMQVRGDPVWLLSPYANLDIDSLEKLDDTGTVATTSAGANIQVRARGGQIIFLKMFAPDQDDHMNPDRTMGSSYPNIIGGFYQVLSVSSSFVNGKFTQSIDGIKLNHLNYVEELFERSGNVISTNPTQQREPANQ